MAGANKRRVNKVREKRGIFERALDGFLCWLREVVVLHPGTMEDFVGLVACKNCKRVVVALRVDDRGLEVLACETETPSGGKIIYVATPPAVIGGIDTENNVDNMAFHVENQAERLLSKLADIGYVAVVTAQPPHQTMNAPAA